MKLIQTIFGSIFPMPSEGRLRIDFGRILRAMGEDSDQENVIKPHEKKHIIFDALCSTSRGEKGIRVPAGSRRRKRSAADAAPL